MELEHSFTIPVQVERAWQVLLDVEQVAPCMPGATIDSVEDDVITGRVKVKVGPIALTYTGSARFTERDDEARIVALEASGKETRGSGTASATVRSWLAEEGGQTRVTVHTTLNVTGRPAQFGRGVMTDVGARIIEKFASNLAGQLAADGQPGDAAAQGRAAAADKATAAAIADGADEAARADGVAGAGSAGGAETSRRALDAATAGLGTVTPMPPQAARPPDEDAIDLLSVAGFPVLKRALPAAAVLLGTVLVLLGMARMRRRRAPRGE